MLRVLVLFLFLYMPFSQATEGDHLAPLSADTQGPNIPDVGSSLFDKLYSKQMSDGTVKYNVPFPLDQLIASQDQTPQAFVHSMFPFSRSLQRPIDLSYNPLLNPRIVFASKDEKKYFSDGKLFLGYVKARNQLEVISYNEEAGRFEYQIVTGYGSSHQNVYYVDRGKCLSCHQGQAPIFSAPSWEDSTFGAMKHLLYEQLNVYAGDDREKKAKVARILFGSIHSSEEIAQLDHLVRKANDISTDERIWIYGCGEDSKCRLGLLIKTLCPKAYDSGKYILYTREILEGSVFRKNQMTYSSFLSSMDIGLRQVIVKYGSIRGVVNSSKALLEVIGNLFRLSDRDNPANRRPMPLAQKDLVKPLSAFHLDDIDALLKVFPSSNEVLRLLVKLEEEGNSIFQNNSINKLEIMATLFEKAGSPLANDYRFWLEKRTPEKVLFEGGFTPVFQTPQLNIMARYCQKCHATSFPFPPQFLVGTEEEVLGNLASLKEKLLYKLENQLMPPNQEERIQFHTSGDYQRVVDFVRGQF